MEIKKSIIKLIAFTSILFFIIAFINKISPTPTFNYFTDIYNNISKSEDNSYYFIGSSRVQKSFHPEILKKHFSNENVYNLGISGSTFLNNSILVDFLINDQKRKTIFIELSPIIPELVNGLMKFSDEADIDIFKSIDSLTKHENLRQKILLKLSIYNQYFFNKIQIKEFVKRQLVEDHIENNKKLMGYVPINDNNFNSITPFITYKELDSPSIKSIDLSSYHKYINYLLESSKKSNSTIVFFLPVTYRNQKEKGIVIPLYQALPDSIKIKYSKKFIKEITDVSYLADNNHFNSAGSKKYTRLLFPFLEPYFSKSK